MVVFNSNYVLFWFLDVKPCRIMRKLYQKVILDPRRYDFISKSEFCHAQTCPTRPKALIEGETLKKNSSIFSTCIFYLKSAFTVGFLAASLGDQGRVLQARCGSAFALSCCKIHTFVTPTPKKLK